MIDERMISMENFTVSYVMIGDKGAYFDALGFICWATPENVKLMWDWTLDFTNVDQAVS